MSNISLVNLILTAFHSFRKGVMEDSKILLKDKHAKYFVRCLNVLPSSMATLDSIRYVSFRKVLGLWLFNNHWLSFRLSISFFAISGLDVLGCPEFLDQNKAQLIDWIYRLQILPDAQDEGMIRCGFRGSLAAARTIGETDATGVSQGSISTHPLDTSHITMTYAAINTLLILGDDLTRLNRQGVLAGVKALQLPNGRLVTCLT